MCNSFGKDVSLACSLNDVNACTEPSYWLLLFTRAFYTSRQLLILICDEKCTFLRI